MKFYRRKAVSAELHGDFYHVRDGAGNEWKTNKKDFEALFEEVLDTEKVKGGKYGSR